MQMQSQALLLSTVAVGMLAVGCESLSPGLFRLPERRELSALRGRVGPSLEIENPILVYLQPIIAPPSPDQARVAPKTVALRRRGGLLQPRFVLTSVGQLLVFSNQDDIHHSIFSYSEPNAFDLGTLAVGETQLMTFSAEGPVPFYCSLHGAEHGLIFVAPSRYTAVADARGEYSLIGVPAGRYWLRTWSDAHARFEVEITLRPRESAWRAIELEAEPSP